VDEHLTQLCTAAYAAMSEPERQVAQAWMTSILERRQPLDEQVAARPERTLTLEEVAERLHCSVKTVRRRINAGELRASHIARGRWEIGEQDLEAFLDAVATRPRHVRPLPPPTAKPVTPSSARAPRRASGGGRLIITDDMGREQL
jgi:excisionase family DNA binding protein